MSSFADSLRRSWRESGIILQLILLNLLIFILLNFSKNFDLHWVDYMAMPMKPADLASRPWTFITCMFAHEDFGHIFYNMLLLWMVGKIFVFVTGFTHWSKITFLYIAGGALGNIFLYAAALALPEIFNAKYCLGASSGVMAIALAVAFFSPDYRVNLIFIGEVKIKWVVAFLFATSTLLNLSMNTGGKISHLGGAVFGTIFGLQLKHGKDLSAWLTKLFSSKKRSNLKVVHKRGVSDYEYNEMRHEKEKTLDELLDKINKSGYESLSKKEKETLHVLSKK
ncbi:MAG: rhomboid family intramembrane serine protease [Bacteroidia bacterium]|nr:rhomboid family intramembrane serine protease [Bacteroidia bacterium]